VIGHRKKGVIMCLKCFCNKIFISWCSTTMEQTLCCLESLRYVTLRWYYD